LRDWPDDTTATGWSAIFSDQVPIPARIAWRCGEDEKRRAQFQPLLIPMRRGFLLPRNDEATTTIMDKHEGFMKALKCRECGREYPLAATHVCEFDFGLILRGDRLKEIRALREGETTVFRVLLPRPAAAGEQEEA